MANISAQAVKASTLKAATRVLFGMASTKAPAGTWLAIAATVPMLKRQADRGLRPALRGEIDRNEGSKSGLNVGDEQIEPVERLAGRGAWPGTLCGRVPVLGLRAAARWSAGWATRRRFDLGRAVHTITCSAMAARSAAPQGSPQARLDGAWQRAPTSVPSMPADARLGGTQAWLAPVWR